MAPKQNTYTQLYQFYAKAVALIVGIYNTQAGNTAPIRRAAVRETGSSRQSCVPNSVIHPPYITALSD